jgi:hypothetical protein
MQSHVMQSHVSHEKYELHAGFRQARSGTSKARETSDCRFAEYLTKLPFLVISKSAMRFNASLDLQEKI